MTATIPEMAPVTMGDRCSKVGKLVAVSWGHTDQDGDDSEDEGSEGPDAEQPSFRPEYLLRVFTDVITKLPAS